MHLGHGMLTLLSGLWQQLASLLTSSGMEEIEMPVRFYVSADLPEEVNTLSLSYTLFQVPNAKESNQAMEVASINL